MGESEHEDIGLVTRIRSGDMAAFERLYDKYKRSLYQTALAITGDGGAAEEVMQDCFVRAHRAMGRVVASGSLSPWLHRIVVNACLDRLRRAKARPTAPLEDVYPVADRTAQVETAIMVQRALMRLPVEQRAAVVAVDMQGYSIADTARLLGVAEGTVKSRCARARVRLAELLGYFKAGARPLPGQA